MTPQAPQAVAVATRDAMKEVRTSDPGIVWVAALPLLLVIALWPTAELLWSLWTTRSRYSHGLLVLAMTVLCSWRVGRRIDWSVARPSRWGWIALVASGLCWLLAVVLDLLSVQGGLVAVLLAAAIWASGGGRVARQFTIPVLLLLCALPVWDPVADVLQWLSLQASGTILDLVGIPAVLDGFHVLIPAGTFEIESGCSGIAYFIVALAIGLYIGVSESLTATRTAIVTAFLAGTAIVANWVRIMLIIYAGHATQMQHSLIVDGHYGFGWGLFGVFFAGALWIVVARLPAGRDPGASDRDVVQPRSSSGAGGALQVAPAVGFLALIAFVSQSSALQPSGRAVAHRWPAHVGAYVEVQNPHDAHWSPSYPGAATTSRAAYVGDGVVLYTYAACYTSQRNGSELIGYFSSPAGAEREVDSEVISQDTRLAALSWHDEPGMSWVGVQSYRIGEWLTGSPRIAKLLHLTLIQASPAPICTLIVATPCSADCSERSKAARTLAAQLVDDGHFASP